MSDLRQSISNTTMKLENQGHISICEKWVADLNLNPGITLWSRQPFSLMKLEHSCCVFLHRNNLLCKNPKDDIFWSMILCIYDVDLSILEIMGRDIVYLNFLLLRKWTRIVGDQVLCISLIYNLLNILSLRKKGCIRNVLFKGYHLILCMFRCMFNVPMKDIHN